MDIKMLGPEEVASGGTLSLLSKEFCDREDLASGKHALPQLRVNQSVMVILGAYKRLLDFGL